jgi:hypothetical protein
MDAAVSDQNAFAPRHQLACLPVHCHLVDLRLGNERPAFVNEMGRGKVNRQAAFEWAVAAALPEL